jgi:hypothetical protein
MIDSRKSLWFNSDRTRLFLVPCDQELSPGEFILRRGVSHQIQVDELALQPYEITCEEARTHLDSQAEHVLDEAKNNSNFRRNQSPLPPTPQS